MDKIRMGLDGRDEQIENFIQQIRAMGQLGIPTFAYNWMALSSWGRTDIALPDRGGALVTGYNQSVAQAKEPLIAEGEVSTAEQCGTRSITSSRPWSPRPSRRVSGLPCTRMIRRSKWTAESPGS